METSGRLGRIAKQLDLLDRHMAQIVERVNTIINLAGLPHISPMTPMEPADCPGLIPSIDQHLDCLCARVDHLVAQMTDMQDQLVGQVSTPATPPAFNPYAPTPTPRLRP